MFAAGPWAPAQAQGTWGDGASTARVQRGPIAFTPSITFTNLGVDNNVFNEATNPKSDVTATIAPNIDAWLRVGRGRVRLGSRLDVLYFNEYRSERTVSTFNTARFEIPLNRFRPYVADTFVRAKERPGLDIDTRARRVENAATAGFEMRVATKTSLDLSVERSTVRFDKDATFMGVDLHDRLNRDGNRLTLAFQQALTPLTSFVMSATAQKDEFTNSPERNSTTVRIMPGLSFRPRALFEGRVHAGVMRYTADNPGIPTFQGWAADIDLGYTFRGDTRLGVRVERGVSYTIDDAASYSLMTGVSGSVTHRAGSRVDLDFSAGRQQLAYRRTATAPVLSGGTAPGDQQIYGLDGGVGLRLGRGVALGVRVNHSRRVTDEAPPLGGEYQNTRLFSFVTYGVR